MVHAVTWLPIADFCSWKMALVPFRSTCKNCKQARQEFNLAGNMLAESGSNAQLGRINCETEEEICHSVDLKGKKLPVVLLFQGSALK
jgi:hypothetical protein